MKEQELNLLYEDGLSAGPEHTQAMCQTNSSSSTLPHHCASPGFYDHRSFNSVIVNLTKQKLEHVGQSKGSGGGRWEVGWQAGKSPLYEFDSFPSFRAWDVAQVESAHRDKTQGSCLLHTDPPLVTKVLMSSVSSGWREGKRGLYETIGTYTLMRYS